MLARAAAPGRAGVEGSSASPEAGALPASPAAQGVVFKVYFNTVKDYLRAEQACLDEGHVPLALLSEELDLALLEAAGKADGAYCGPDRHVFATQSEGGAWAWSFDDSTARTGMRSSRPRRASPCRPTARQSSSRTRTPTQFARCGRVMAPLPPWLGGQNRGSRTGPLLRPSSTSQWASRRIRMGCRCW
mmetsp:Transcript_36745/g.92383  ORF Transcript_36745/g.92383 Transcript_36745/m.92383 type:complete len:189 (+) Transcript_36745:143-709(+)